MCYTSVSLRIPLREEEQKEGGRDVSSNQGGTEKKWNPLIHFTSSILSFQLSTPSFCRATPCVKKEEKELRKDFFFLLCCLSQTLRDRIKEGKNTLREKYTGDLLLIPCILWDYLLLLQPMFFMETFVHFPTCHNWGDGLSLSLSNYQHHQMLLFDIWSV